MLQCVTKVIPPDSSFLCGALESIFHQPPTAGVHLPRSPLCFSGTWKLYQCLPSIIHIDPETSKLGNPPPLVTPLVVSFVLSSTRLTNQIPESHEVHQDDSHYGHHTFRLCWRCLNLHTDKASCSPSGRKIAISQRLVTMQPRVRSSRLVASVLDVRWFLTIASRTDDYG